MAKRSGILGPNCKDKMDYNNDNSLSLASNDTRGSLSLTSEAESGGSAEHHFDQMLGRDHRQTITAVSRLAAYMGRTGKGINHIFKDLDASGDGKLSHHELEQALVELDINITTAQAHALVTFIDSDGDGEIDVKELDSTIRAYKRRKRAGQLGSWHGNLSVQQDPVFPNWLIGREDFQQVFSRFSVEAGVYGLPELDLAIRKQPEDRLHRDVQVITNWLGQQDSFRSLGAKRLIEVTHAVEFQEFEPEARVFDEGDDSEAFYIVLSGHVVVFVKQCPVAVLGSGETFGELGLQNLEQRTAGVKADKSGAILAKMPASNYRHILSKFLMDKMQLKINLLQDAFALAQNWTPSKIRAFAYCMAHHRHVRGEYIYRQGEPAHNLYIVFRGKVLAQRVLRYRFVNRWPISNSKSHQRNSMKQVVVNLKVLSVGETTGEDCVLGFTTRQHQVVALTQDVQVCVVSRSNAFLYLTSADLDQLHNQTQDLYRYGEDNMTPYFKAVQGWQDATKIKNEVIGPSYRKRLQVSERQAQARNFRGRHDATHQHQNTQSAKKHAVGVGPNSQSSRALPNLASDDGRKSTSSLPSSSRPQSQLTLGGGGGRVSGTVVVRGPPGKGSRTLKFPPIDSGKGSPPTSQEYSNTGNRSP